MKADLARSGIEPKQVPAWKLVGPAELAKLCPTYDVEWAYSIPYPRTFNKGPTLTRYKILAWKPGPFGVERPHGMKYLQPEKSPAGVYFPEGPTWPKLFAVESPHALLIVEGEKKAVAGTACLMPTIGLGGVWNWASKKQGLTLLPELAAIHWSGRPVFLCFDSDTATNPQVARALAELTAVLVARGAFVHEATIPKLPGCEKAGLDDFIVHHGVKAREALQAHFDDHADVGEVCQKMFEFNHKFAVIVTPTAILDETRQDMFDRPIQALHAGDKWVSLIVPHERVKVFVGDPEDAKTKIAQMSEVWLHSPAHREYSALTYAPGGPRVLNHGTRYNSWHGLGIEPKKGCVRPFLDLFDYFFPNTADKAMKLWALRWFGYPLKFLGAKHNTIMAIWSREQGTGKSMLGDSTLGPIYGSNYIAIKQSEFEGDFTGWAANKQFIMVDEVSATDAKMRADAIKKMVTEKLVRVNEKFIAAYEIPAHENFYMTSNSAAAFGVTDEDRRYFVWEVKGSPLSTKFYDHYLEKWVGVHEGGPPTGPGLLALLWYFQNELDYGDFNPKASAPRTEAKSDMAAIHRHPAEHWVRTFFAQLVRDPTASPREVWTPTELALRYKVDNPSAPHISVNGFGVHIAAAGLPRWRGEVGHQSHRLVAVTAFEKWKKAKPAEWIKEANKAGKF